MKSPFLMVKKLSKSHEIQSLALQERAWAQQLGIVIHSVYLGWPQGYPKALSVPRFFWRKLEVTINSEDEVTIW